MYNFTFGHIEFKEALIEHEGLISAKINIPLYSQNLEIPIDFSPSNIVEFNYKLQNIKNISSLKTLELLHYSGSIVLNYEDDSDYFDREFFEQVLKVDDKSHLTNPPSNPNLNLTWQDKISVNDFEELKEEFGYFSSWVKDNTN